VISLAVGLPLKDLAKLQALADAASDPTSATYRQHIQPADFMANYAPSASDYSQLVAWARSNGLTVGTYPNNIVADLTGTAAQIDQALSVNLNSALRPDGTTFFEPDRIPSVGLTVQLLGVSGLDNYVLPTPGGSATAPCAPGALRSSDLRGAYLGAGSCAGLQGSGQSIGLLALAGFTASDITMYESQSGLSGVPAVQVQTTNDPHGLSPGCPSCAPGPVAPPLAATVPYATIECSFDIELAIAMAPRAQIVVFEGTLPDSILENMAANPGVSQLSSSMLNLRPTALAPTLLTVLAAQGQSFFQASGDSGAFDPPSATCTPAAGTSATSDRPSDFRSMPYVTIVGGTNLRTNAGTYQGESTWVKPLVKANPPSVQAQPPGGTGGGILTSVTIPSYQIGANPNNPDVSTANRNAPDVAMVANNLLLITTGCNGQFPNQICPTANLTPGQCLDEGGTSGAAPLWAGFMALVNEQNKAAWGPVGFANPAIYKIGKDPAAYAVGFNDIQDGVANQNACMFPGYKSVAGYDLATGWGTPTCGLVSELSGSPTIKVGASGTDGGPFICISGNGFSPGGTVTVQYAGAPEFPNALDVITSTQAVQGAGGNFHLVDNEVTAIGGPVSVGVSGCTAAEIANGVVSVNVVDNKTGASVTATMPASYWCTVGQTTTFGAGCASSAPPVTITYHQTGACVVDDVDPNNVFTSGPNRAYAIFGIEGIDNSQGTTAFTFDPAKLFIAQPTGLNYFDSSLAIYKNLFVSFAAIQDTIGAGTDRQYGPSADGATTVTTSTADGAVEANQTSYLLNYTQQHFDPPVTLVKSNASQTSFGDSEDCSAIVLH
ncbi:MAG: S53 family peptidase, partial [Polyangiaceae bacterium]